MAVPKVVAWRSVVSEIVATVYLQVWPLAFNGGRPFGALAVIKERFKLEVAGVSRARALLLDVEACHPARG